MSIFFVFQPFYLEIISLLVPCFCTNTEELNNDNDNDTEFD